MTLPTKFPCLTMTPVTVPSLDDTLYKFEHFKDFPTTKISFKKRNLEENFIAPKVFNVSNGYGYLTVQGVKKWL